MSKKSNIYQLLELIIIFILTLLFNLFCNELNHDEVWTYGFAYNITAGLIPYRDFNMVTTPLYPLLASAFMSILGRNIVVYHIFNAIICTTIFSYMKKLTPDSSYITYAILLFFSTPGYNISCLLFLYILIYFENKKADDYLVGLIIGLTILTKQSIGIYLFIPTLFTKSITKIVKRIIGLATPIILLLVYLICNHNLYDMIDYCFLGILNFAKANNTIYITTIAIVVISIVYHFS